MAGIANIVNQKYGTLVSDWLIVLLFYMAVCLWFYWAWHTERIGRLRSWLLYTYPRMFLVALIIGGAVIGAAAGAGLWVVNRNEQRMKVAPEPTQEQSAEKHKAGLVGRIICLNAETHANTEHEIFRGEYPRDFIVTINVSVTNDSTLPATATKFELSLIANDKVHSCVELPISKDKSFIKRSTRMPGGMRKIKWEPLTPFPLNIEIANTTHQSGWLKFWAGPIPTLSLDAAELTLIVYDHRNEPRVIYHGPIRQPSACGEIVEGVPWWSLPHWD
jgi:hypothetical protein